jgi:thiamine biosynthesis lipoprotein ApbE
MLKMAKELYVKTGGSVNVAFGAVLGIWHDYREAGVSDPEHAELPPMEQLRSASGHTDIENLIIEKKPPPSIFRPADAAGRRCRRQRVCSRNDGAAF